MFTQISINEEGERADTMQSMQSSNQDLLADTEVRIDKNAQINLLQKRRKHKAKRMTFNLSNPTGKPNYDKYGTVPT